MTISDELIKYMKDIEDFSKDMGQDSQALHEYLIQLTNYMARANFLMADHQRIFRKEKLTAYRTLVASSHAQQQYFAPSLAKDFIDAQCGESGYIYDLAERLSRLCVHTLDAIRTVVSSLKSERSFSNSYGS